MTRARQPVEGDHHQKFTSWLTSGAGDEPARELALHGAYCPECRANMGALDLLSLIDTGRASLPPSRPSQVSQRVPALKLPLVGAATAALLVVAIAGWALRGSPMPLTGESQSPAQQVLGGAGGGSASPTPLVSQESEESADARRTHRPTASPATIQPLPSANPPSPEPTDTATPRPTRSPRPTAPPTPSPTEVPEPTRVAVPEICDDGIDNDGDGLIDILDPDCLLDGDEAST